MKTSMNRFAFAAMASVLMNAAAEGGEGAAPAKPLTLAEKLTAKATALHSLITSKTAEYNDILTQLNAIALIANVAAGDTVTAVQGKGDKAQTVTGVVLGVAEDEVGKLVKVQSGSGFDTTVFTFRAAQITTVTPPVGLEAQASDEVVEMPAATPEFDAQYQA